MQPVMSTTASCTSESDSKAQESLQFKAGTETEIKDRNANECQQKAGCSFLAVPACVHESKAKRLLVTGGAAEVIAELEEEGDDDKEEEFQLGNLV